MVYSSLVLKRISDPCIKGLSVLRIGFSLYSRDPLVEFSIWNAKTSSVNQIYRV